MIYSKHFTFKLILAIFCNAFMGLMTLAETSTKPISIRKHNKPIEIDGLLTENIWTTTNSVPLADVISKTAVIPPGFGTFVKIWRSDKALYLGFRCETPFAPLLKTEKRFRDGNAYSDECIEIFIDPKNGKKSRQFVLNASGSPYDGFFFVGGGWNGSWQCATSISRGVWFAEIKIPFTDLGGVPKDGNKLLINCCRVAYGKNGIKKWITVLKKPGYFAPRVPIQITD
jgi:cellulose/xylan binding protein with CBM9 domain